MTKNTATCCVCEEEIDLDRDESFAMNDDEILCGSQECWDEYGTDDRGHNDPRHGLAHFLNRGY